MCCPGVFFFCSQDANKVVEAEHAPTEVRCWFCMY